MMRYGLIALLGILLILGGITYVSADKQPGVHTITITDQDMQPRAVHVKLNSQVKITVKNIGTKKHNLVIPDYYIFTHNLNVGEATDIEFTANKAGQFSYYSDTPGKQEPGLDGWLVVR